MDFFFLFTIVLAALLVLDFCVARHTVIYHRKLWRQVQRLHVELEHSREEVASLKNIMRKKISEGNQGLHETIAALEEKVKNRTAEYHQVSAELEKLRKTVKPKKRARTSRSTNNS